MPFYYGEHCVCWNLNSSQTWPLFSGCKSSDYWVAPVRQIVGSVCELAGRPSAWSGALRRVWRRFAHQRMVRARH